MPPGLLLHCRFVPPEPTRRVNVGQPRAGGRVKSGRSAGGSQGAGIIPPSDESWLVPDDRRSGTWFEPPVEDQPPTESVAVIVPDVVEPPVVEAPPPSEVAVEPSPPIQVEITTAPSTSTKRRRRRPRVRKVTRVLRRVDAWSVFKLSMFFWLTVYAILLIAGVLLWSIIVQTGTLDNLEKFLATAFARDSFAIDGQSIFKAGWVLGLLGVVALTGASVAAVVFFNLISDLTGGIRLTVLEEEVVLIERPVPTHPVEPGT